MRDVVFLALLVVMLASSIGWLVQATPAARALPGRGVLARRRRPPVGRSQRPGPLREGAVLGGLAHFSVEHDEIVFARAMLVTGIVSQAGFVAMLLLGPA